MTKRVSREASDATKFKQSLAKQKQKLFRYIIKKSSNNILIGRI